MKFLLIFTIFALSLEAINCQDPYNLCVNCESPPYVAPALNCSCPANSVRQLRKYACGPACDAQGNCCEFKQPGCQPSISCPPNMHREYTTPFPQCKCVCNNFGLLKCPLPSKYNPKTCNCECPWGAWKSCPKNKYFDWESCSCKCKEQCIECSGAQKWDENVCQCRCPYKKKCKSNQFWNEWSCQCECLQAPRPCCPELGRIWSWNSCDCVCKQTLKCPFNTVWNSWTCSCEPIKHFYPIDPLYPWVVPDENLLVLCDNGQQAPICNSEQHLDLQVCQCVWNIGWGTGTGVASADSAPAQIATP